MLCNPKFGQRVGILGLLILGTIARAQVNPSVHGVLETYFLESSTSKGAAQKLSWAEIRARLTNNWSATWSGFDSGSSSGYDESYIRYENDMGSIRAGRLRTSFGFSDWSENFYNGFNHKPLVREASLVGKTRLDRDDDGAEITANFGRLQIQAAALETVVSKAQVGADAIDHGTFTALYGFGALTLGAELLTSNNGSQKIYGANFRYTIPYWIFKGEYFKGVGLKSGLGDYVEAIYRLPSHTRTQLVASVEEVRITQTDAACQLQTLGIRQIFNPYFTANLNYGWGKELDYSPYAASSGLSGWTLQGLFQVHF